MKTKRLESILKDMFATRREAADFLHCDERSLRRYLKGELPVPPLIETILETMASFGINPDQVALAVKKGGRR